MSSRPKIYVEGVDDFNVIIHLLKLNGFSGYEGEEPEFWPSCYPQIESREFIGVDALMKGANTLINDSVKATLGFVIDADDKLSKRWNQLREYLEKAEYAPIPETIPANGYIGFSKNRQSYVGVWIMPDNSSVGKLEHFLKSMVKSEDVLFKHAIDATRQAKELNAKFSDLDKPKAEMYAWLAWQEKPGKPYGIAIKSKYFNAQSPEAQKFVAWVKKLVGFVR